MITSPDQPDFEISIENGIRSAREGNVSDLGALVNTYRPYLLKMASSHLTRDIAIKFAPSDAVQETMLQAARDFPQFRGATEVELRQWLQTILLRNLSDVNRQYRQTEKRKISLEFRVDSQTVSRAGLQLVGRDPSPSSGLKAEESSETLQQVIRGLPEEYQTAIRLRNFEKLSFEEIGTKMQRTSEAARKLWCRAIQRLAQEYQLHHADASRSK